MHVKGTRDFEPEPGTFRGPPIAAAAAGILGFSLAGAALVYGVKGARSQMFGPSVFRGPGLRRSIAFTFDDGPSPSSPILARYLAEERVRATFFQCGVNVLRYPEIARSLAVAGHEIGNHSLTHRRLCPRLGWKTNVLGARTVYEEFAEAQQIITEHTGSAPRVMRAPYGMRWRGMARACRSLGLLGVHWTVIGHDWEWEGERIAEHVLRRAGPGVIVCLHDGRDTKPNPDITHTLSALRILVPALRARGYSFESVSEILH